MNTSPLVGRTIIVQGASRGLGQAAAIRLGELGANVVVTGRSVTNGRIPGTIHQTVDTIEKSGGRALAVQMDVRDYGQIQAMAQATLTEYGAIHGLLNSASVKYQGELRKLRASKQSGKMGDIDRLVDINLKGMMHTTQVVVRHIMAAGGGHVINFGAPSLLSDIWVSALPEGVPDIMRTGAVYAMTKMGGTFDFTMVLANKLASRGVAAVALWPRTAMRTAAVSEHYPQHVWDISREPRLIADAVAEIFASDPNLVSGRFLIDEAFLRRLGRDGVFSAKVGAEGYDDRYFASMKNPTTDDAALGLDFFLDGPTVNGMPYWKLFDGQLSFAEMQRRMLTAYMKDL